MNVLIACKAKERGKVSRRGEPSIEWCRDGKPQCYCYGYIDKMTDEVLPECKECSFHVGKAQDDLDKFYGGGLSMRLIDAVEVVRCKDCKHHYWEQEPCHGKSVHYCKLPHMRGVEVFKEFFCYYGERKEGADK